MGDIDCWGSFIPMGNPSLRRMDFLLFQPFMKVGRDPLCNTFTYNSKYVSKEHFVVDGVKLQKDEYRSLRDGQEISFGRDGREYVYTFRVGDIVKARSAYKDYEIICLLGRGGFGEVKKALNKKTGGFVAIKVIKLNKHVQLDGETSREAISREIEILKAAQHPNIVTLENTYAECDKISVVLEYVNGGDLHHFMHNTRDVVDEPMAQHLMFQLCDALYYLHSCNIAHRDLKPSNILLTRENPPFLKLADFGLAKVVNSTVTLFKSAFLGTRAFMAPEVFQNAPYTPLIDSWSVGMIVFYLFTYDSMVPDVNPSSASGYFNVLQRDYIYIQTYTPYILDSFDTRYRRLSAAARHFVRQLLQVDPEKRMPITGTMVHSWFLGYQPVYAWNADKEIVKKRDLLPLNEGNERVCLPFARREIVGPDNGFFKEADSALAGDIAEMLSELEERDNVAEA
ncbi:kinase-like protein [Hymenopellis radicata]|nr:kinase-like protein [Hymenopellis radicata]